MTSSTECLVSPEANGDGKVHPAVAVGSRLNHDNPSASQRQCRTARHLPRPAPEFASQLGRSCASIRKSSYDNELAKLAAVQESSERYPDILVMSPYGPRQV